MSKAEKLVGWGGWEDVRKKEMGERSLGGKASESRTDFKGKGKGKGKKRRSWVVQAS